MRRSRLAFAVLVFLGATRLAAEPCNPSDANLCLSASRFRVEVAWKDFQGRTGAGHAVVLTPDTGYFWFFNSANVELVVKVLDARGVNGKFWVFFGALSNVEYTLKVTDTATGSTKSYFNPAGRFASVADTAAFAGGAATAGHQTSLADGSYAAPSSNELIQRFIDSAPRAAAFTPCPDTRFGMLLTGCRFHIEVEYDAGQGRSGHGHWVQLTNDTGYFWFFNAANVELVVKVLDARPINRKFWVFFGALSDVRYTITVTDTLTGTQKRYLNPAKKLASVGDTGAFQGGFSVAAVRDSAHAVSAELDPAGGELTATGADGTVFTLDLPPRALDTLGRVTLTPISHLGSLPFSGGLVAGVEIEPAGLELNLPATLTIQPASPPPVGRTLPFFYRRGGEDFILYPRHPNAASLSLSLVELGGYGAALGELPEAATQVNRPPTALLAPYLQRYAYEVLLHLRGQISQTELRVRATKIFREAWDTLVGLKPAGAPAIAAPSPDVETIVSAALPPGWKCDAEARKDLETMFGLIRQQQMLGIEDETGRVETGIDAALEYLRECQNQAFDRCKQLNDPFEIGEMLDFAREMQELGEEDPLLTTFIEGGLMERCMRFELDFESKITATTHTAADVDLVQRLRYRARVPLRFNYGDNFYGNRVWDGGCPLPNTLAQFQIEDPECHVTVTAGNGHLSIDAAWIALLPSSEKSGVVVLYDTGMPGLQATLHCPDSPAVPFGVVPWGGQYFHLHDKDRSDKYPVYVAKDWIPLRFDSGPSQNGEFFAMKPYERTVNVTPETNFDEETWFFLKHTPDAPSTCR